MEDKYNNGKKYVKAFEKVKSLKQFYIHFFIFLIANPVIPFCNNATNANAAKIMAITGNVFFFDILRKCMLTSI